MTCNVRTKFDSISTAAYSKNIADETLVTLSEMAPAELNPQQKVRFLEVLAASAPEVQSKGKETPSASQSTEAQPPCGSQDAQGQEGRVIWTHEAVLLLIERRRALQHLFESNTTTQRQAWRKVVEELRTKGYKYSEDDCSKKFRSLRARHKTIKEKKRQTGNSCQSWRYFDVMEDMFAGDPAVLPATIVSSMRSEQVHSPVEDSHVNDEDTLDELQLTSTPRVQRKRRRSSAEEEPPQWFERYQQSQKDMHEERMALEKRRVGALEALVKLLQEKN